MKRDLLLNTAFELFNERGPRFTLDELARRMRISKKTIYTEVGNKEAVLHAAVQSLFASIKEQEKAIIADDSLGPVEKVIQVICIYPSQRINYSFVEDLRAIYPDVFARIHQELEANWEQTFELLGQAAEAGRLRPLDRENFRIILLGLFTELISYDEGVQQTKMRECLDMILRGYVVEA